MKDLTVSNIDRQNILNNYIVLSQLQDYVGIPVKRCWNEFSMTKERDAEIEDATKLNDPEVSLQYDKGKGMLNDECFDTLRNALG